MGSNARRVGFLNLEYLRQGTAKQRQAASVIDELELWEHLKSYSPILVGTIPIGIDIASSDLDIICHVTEFDRFERELRAPYDRLVSDFSYSFRSVGNVERAVARFRYKGWNSRFCSAGAFHEAEWLPSYGSGIQAVEAARRTCKRNHHRAEEVGL